MSPMGSFAYAEDTTAANRNTTVSGPPMPDAQGNAMGPRRGEG